MTSFNSTRTALRRSGVLTASAAGLWLVMAGPAYWLAGATGLEGLSYAALLCLTPGCVVFFAVGWLGAADNQSVSFLAGTGLRMLTVLLGALLIHETRSDLGLRQFFGWLVLFYSVTLVVETLLIVKSPGVVASETIADSAKQRPGELSSIYRRSSGFMSSDTFHHVRDFPYFEVPQFLGEKIHLPMIGDFQLTKFMVLQVVAAVLVFWIATGLAKRVRGGKPVSGRWWNFWEMLALYLRDNVVRPTIGDGHHGHDDHGHDDHGHKKVEMGHPADKYLPFIWSCFFYVLMCNLLGAIPWLGSPTGEINVTGALAVVAFGATIFYGSQTLGFAGFWKALCPSMDVPGAMKPLLIPMIWCIELLGLFIKHGVLAVRLFANIMAGHTVVAVFLGFIAMFGTGELLFYVVTPASILAQVGVGLLELFVAFLQAYIFAFLATLFIGTAVHPH